MTITRHRELWSPGYKYGVDGLIKQIFSCTRWKCRKREILPLYKVIYYSTLQFIHLRITHLERILLVASSEKLDKNYPVVVENPVTGKVLQQTVPYEKTTGKVKKSYMSMDSI